MPGRVQTTQATRELLGERFDLEERGTIEVKGKGAMPVFLVAGERTPGRGPGPGQ